VVRKNYPPTDEIANLSHARSRSIEPMRKMGSDRDVSRSSKYDDNSTRQNGDREREGGLLFPILAARGHDNFHAIGADDLDFCSGKDHPVDGIRHGVPKLAPDSHIAARVQTFLCHAARADEGLRTGLAVGLIGAPEVMIHPGI
jgi:hypothetical protein